MKIAATSRSELRSQFVDKLRSTIPAQGLSSSSPTFQIMTGWDTQRLQALWNKGSKKTCCNEFAGWVAREILGADGVLASSRLDLSGVEDMHPGTWIWANTDEAIQYRLHPLPGDFYCAPFPGQQWGHVGIVTDMNEDTLEWKWVAAGQGGPASHADWIRWGPWQPKSARTFTDARANVVGWVDIGQYFFPNGPD